MSNRRKAKEPSQEPADGSSWKAEEERDLLLFLFAVGNVTNRIVGNGKGRITAWPVVCKLFTDKGYSRTRNALQ